MPAFLFVLLFSVTAEAQMRWGVRAGIVDEDPMIGGDLLFALPAGFVLNPNIEFTSDAFVANADVHYDFALNPRTDLWVGAGLSFVNPDESEYDGGFNVHAGVGGRRGRWYPFAQLRYTSAGDIDEFASLAVGLRF
jgi:hypothetical protein